MFLWLYVHAVCDALITAPVPSSPALGRGRPVQSIKLCFLSNVSVLCVVTQHTQKNTSVITFSYSYISAIDDGWLVGDKLLSSWGSHWIVHSTDSFRSKTDIMRLFMLNGIINLQTWNENVLPKLICFFFFLNAFTLMERAIEIAF